MSHYWKLDETGPPYADFYGTDNATCTNCPTATTGIVSGAQQFTAASSVNAADDNTFDWGVSDSFSIEFWMKTDPASTCSGNQVIVGRKNSPSGLLWVGCADGGAAAFELYDSNGTGTGITGSKDLTDGNWHHIVAVRDASANQNLIYVDGILENSKSATYLSGFDFSVPLNIGWLNLASGFHFLGTIDEVALYNKALSDIEIRSHYYLTRGYCDMCSTPVKIMPLGDSITHGYNGQITDNDYMASYRRQLYFDLVGGGYNVDFVGSLQSGVLLNPQFDIDHEGHDGYSAHMIANDLNIEGVGDCRNNCVTEWLSANPADVILLHIGTNDFDAVASADDVAAILDKVDSYNKNITVLLARIINWKTYNPAVTDFNNAVIAMAQSRIATKGDKIIIVNEENALTYPDDMNGTLHPTQAGYDKMANPWFNALITFLPICEDVAPMIISTPPISVASGQPYIYDVNAIGKPAPTYSLATTPPGMTINTGTGLIEWTPNATGSYDVTVQASNGIGFPATQSFTIKVLSCSSGMIHYWSLDETASPYIDLYGDDNATCESCPSPTTGFINGAQQFTSTSRVNVFDDGTFNWGATDSFSIEFWMKTDSASTCSGNQVIVGRKENPTGLMWVGCSDGGQATFELWDKNGNGGGITGTKDLTDGNWHHIVAVRDASANQNLIYVDGILENSEPATYSTGFDFSVPLNMGWLNLSSGYHFAGTIDEVALYNKALSDMEILQHYDHGLEGYGYCNTTHTVTPSAGANGSIDPFTPQTVNHGSTISFTVTPNTGNHTVSVSGCGGTWTGTNPYTTGPITANCTVTATFAVNTYAVTPSVVGGSIEPSTPQTVNYGSTTSFTVTPNTGYHTESVTGTCGGTLTGNTYTTALITGNCTVIATFAPYTAVKLLAPNGGEIIPSGRPDYPISWEAPPEAVSFNLTYSLDNGLTWIPIASNVPGASYNSYNWSVPKPWGNTKACLVKVKGFDSSNGKVGVAISALFTIEVVKVELPNGGETWKVGETHDITWTTNGTKKPVAKVKRYYTKDGGITWVLIDKLTDPAYLTEGTHSYPCPVPTVGKTKNQCKVKVELIDALGNILGTDKSDDYFTIEGPVKLTSPNGQEVLTPGTHTITWTTDITDGVEKVKLFYTKNDGLTWIPIKALTELEYLTKGPHSYDEWTVPEVDKTKCKVRVELRDAVGNILGQDESDDYFTIKP